jgi:hypothetical protein
MLLLGCIQVNQLEYIYIYSKLNEEQCTHNQIIKTYSMILIIGPHKIVALKPFKSKILQICFLKFLNLGQWVEINVAFCILYARARDNFQLIILNLELCMKLG